MTGEQIKVLIDKTMVSIKEELFQPGTFILNHEMKEKMEQIAILQEQCPHQFEGGFCIYCYLKQGEEKQ